MEEETGIKQYGKNKQHQPLPQVGMGLFIDHDGIPMAFDIFPGSINEQPTLKPLQEKIINNYGLDQIIVCTDAGLSSMRNRKLNNKTIDGKRLRSFITTQSVKMLPEYLKEFALDVNGWHLPGSDKVYNIVYSVEASRENLFTMKRNTVILELGYSYGLKTKTIQRSIIFLHMREEKM